MKRFLSLMPVLSFVLPGLALAHTGGVGAAAIMHDLSHSFGDAALLFIVVAAVVWVARKLFSGAKR